MRRGLLLGACAALLAGTVSAQTTVDDFTTAQAQLLAPPTSGSSALNAGILGGERDIRVHRFSVSGTISAEVVGGSFVFTGVAGTLGEARVVWDGADADANVITFPGLAGENLSGSADNFLLTVNSASAGTVLILEVYTDATNSSLYTFLLPAVATSTAFHLPFADFVTRLGTGADFSNVGAISLTVRGDGASLSLDSLVTSAASTVGIDATKAATLVTDVDADTRADVGDTLKYTILIRNRFGKTGTGVTLADTLDVNTNLNIGTVQTSPIGREDYYFQPVATILVAPPGVLTNDNDPDGDAISVATPGAVTTSTGVTATVNADGSFSVAPLGDGTLDTFSYQVTDGNGITSTAVVTVGLVSQALVVTTTSGLSSFTEDGGAQVVDAGVTVTDSASPTLVSATVTITNPQNGALEVLAATTCPGLTVTPGLNSLSITGTATLAVYQTCLQSVTYNNTAPNPGTTTRYVSFVANDGTLTSNTAIKGIAMTESNDAPVLTAAGTLSYTENQAATAIDTGITVTDVDSPTLTQATTTISVNFQSGEDVLSFTNDGSTMGNIAVTGNAGGVLTLSSAGGTATLAQWQSALRAVKYNNTSENPSTLARTVTWQVNDGGAVNNLSNQPTSTINVTAANDAPVVTTSGGATAFTEDGGAVTVDNALTVTDADGTTLASATVTITNALNGGAEVLGATTCPGLSVTGTNPLSITGSAALGVYQTCLRSVTYNNTSQNPNTTPRVLAFVANDGTTPGAAGNKTVTVAAVNDAPVLANGSTLNYTENQAATAINTLITVADADNTTLASGTVSITNNLATAEDVLSFTNVAGMGNIAGSYAAGTGVMTLTSSGSTATLLEWQAALRAVKYSNTSESPSTLARTVSYVVNDGTAPSNTVTSTVNVSSVNDAPVVTTSGGSASFTEDGAAVAIDPGLTATDVDNATFASGTVQITGALQTAEDVLAFTNNGSTMGNIAAAAYVPATGLLTLTSSGATATKAEWQNALRAVTYNNTSQNPNTTARTVTFKVNDGAVDSNLATRGVTVTGVNDAPVLGGVSGGFTYTENDVATVIAAALTVTDVDSATMSSATITISTFQSGQDVLSFANAAGMGNVAVSSNVGGVLTLSSAGSTATKAEWETALRAVKYNNTSEEPNTSLRTVTFQINDGGALNNLSNQPTRTITVVSVNDPPTANAFSNLPAQASIPITYPAGKLGGTDVEAGTTITIDLTPINVTNGTVSLNANGSFVFTPVPTATTASFQYRVSDNGNPGPGLNSAYATVSFTVAGPALYFVKSAGAGNCTLGNECTLATAVSNIGLSANAKIFISDANSHGSAVPQNSGGWLIGQGVTGTTFDTLFSIGTPAQGTLATRPSLSLARPTVTSTVGLNTNGAVRGLNVSSTTLTGMNDPGPAITGVFVSEVAVTTTTGTGVSFSNTAGTFSLDGLTTTGGAGASLTGVNSGGTFNFTGVSVSSGANAAFVATGGGTVQVTGATNTLTSTTGTALNVANTTIGASGLTFRSISTNGAANGIVLNNTGATAGLTVTGDGGGTNNGSGGTIQSSTGIGINLTTTRAVSLSHVNVTNSADAGIKGISVTNFTLNRSNINNNGNSTSDEGIQFGEFSGATVGVTGTVQLTNCSVNGNAHNNFHLRNTSGTISSFTVTGSTFNDLNDTFGANAFLYEMSGTAVTTAASLSSNTFTNNSPQRALEVQTHDTGTIGGGGQYFVVSGSTFTNNGIHASFTQDTSSNIAFKFINNGNATTRMTGSTLQAINVFSSSQSTGGTIVGVISGNFVGTTSAGAISTVIQGQTDATLLIDGNNINGTNGDSRAIGIAFRGPANPLAGTLGANTVISDLTITNNTVTPGAAPSGFPLATIVVEADNQSGADNKSPTVRADIRGNVVPTSTVFDFLDAHIIFYEYDAGGGHGIGELFDSAPASGTATAQLQSTNTGTAGAFGVALTSTPVLTPP